MNVVTNLRQPVEKKAGVYCPICTHTVEGTVVTTGRTVRVKPGERCPRCNSSLEAGIVMRLQQAA